MPQGLMHFAQTALHQASDWTSSAANLYLRVSVTMGVLLAMERGRALRSCRSCDAALGDPFLDLGKQPLANAYIRQENAVNADLAPSTPEIMK